MPTAICPHIRWMIRRDLPEILAIEAETFLEPWPEQDILRTLSHKNCIGMVAESGDRIIGFMIHELYKTGLVLLRLAVPPGQQRRSIGRSMMARLEGKLSPWRRTWLRADVPAPALPAQLFFRALGWKAVGILKPGDDAESYRMEYHLPSGS